MPDLLGGSDWKIFKLNDCEWYVGRSRDEAIAAACSDWGCKSVDEAIKHHMLELDDVAELGDESLDTLRFIDDDEDGNRCGESRTFREELALRVAAGLKEGEMFASTEF